MTRRARLLLAPLLGGIVAGAADFTAACLINGASPAVVATVISRGWYGKAGALTAGPEAVPIGLASHFFISIVAAAVYLLASRRMTLLTRRPLLCGIAFGVCVFCFMHMVVLPLSAVGAMAWPRSPRNFSLDLISHMAFGAIIAYATARIAPPARPQD